MLVMNYYLPNTIEGTSNNLFISDFLSNIGQLNLECNQFITVGDFSLNIKNAQYADATQFLDLLDALELSQLIDVPRHRYSNILDLVIVNIMQGPYFSDHCVNKFLGEINKPKVNYHKVKFRNFKVMDTTKMVQDMHLDEVKGNFMYVLLLILNCSIRQAVERHAPLKEKWPLFVFTWVVNDACLSIVFLMASM